MARKALIPIVAVQDGKIIIDLEAANVLNPTTIQYLIQDLKGYKPSKRQRLPRMVAPSENMTIDDVKPTEE
jgi:hypothetical protein